RPRTCSHHPDHHPGHRRRDRVGVVGGELGLARGNSGRTPPHLCPGALHLQGGAARPARWAGRNERTIGLTPDSRRALNPVARSGLDLWGGAMAEQRKVGSVTYREAGRDYFEKRGLRRHAGVWSLWALGVAAVISGDFSGWNFGLDVGGFG